MNDQRTQLVCLLGAAASLLLLKKLRDKKRRKRRLRSQSWFLRREESRGAFNILENELRVVDPDSCRHFLQICRPHFDELLNLIRSDVIKMDANMRQIISPEKKLAVTLRFLATGETFKSLMYSTRIPESTISVIVPYVCKCIYKNLKDIYLKIPRSVDEWLQISTDFENMYNFPMCIGSIDGKHINFRPPRNVESFYNYKEHSVILLAMCDANHKFTYVDVGVNSRTNDADVFRDCSLKPALDSDVLSFPPDKILTDQNTPVPHLIVANDMFPLSRRLMKPFPNRGLTTEKRAFNSRLLRAREVIENSFEILTNRFRILLSIINLAPEKVEDLVLTCCVLHNFFATKNHTEYASINENTGSSSKLTPLQQLQGGNRATQEALAIRNQLAEYFVKAEPEPSENNCLD